jgi:tetratricopeptide (TPR) repeat protein
MILLRRHSVPSTPNRFVRFLLLFALVLAGASCNRDPQVQKQKYLDSGNRYFNNSKYKEASIMYRRALKEDMRFGEAWYRLGLTELQTGRIVDALRALQRAVELQPENIEAQAKVGEIYMSVYSADPKRPPQYLTEADEMATKILERDPNSFEGLRLKGFVHLARKELKEAIAKFEAANIAKPDQNELQLTLAQAYLFDKQPQKAEAIAKQGIERNPTFGSFYDLLLGIYLTSNRQAEAEQILKQKSVKNPSNASYVIQLAAYYWGSNRKQEAEEQLNRILASKESFPSGRALVGDFYLRTREFGKAIEQYEKGVEEQPADKATYQKRMVPVLLMQAKNDDASRLVAEILKDNPKDESAIAMRSSMALRSGNRDDINRAVTDLESLVAKQPKNQLLRFDFARGLMAKGEVEQAKVQLQEAIKLRPDFVAPRMALAQIHLSKGDFSQAAQSAEQILEYEPNNTAAKLIRSGAMVGMKDYVKARQELSTMLDQNPALTDAQFQLGMVNFSEGKLREAENEFRKLYQTSPNDPRGLMGTVETLVAQKRMREALALLENEIKKSPDRADLRRAFANTAYRDGNYDLALKELRALHEKSPNDVGLMMRIGETLNQMGDLKGAIEMVEKAKTAAPNSIVPTLTLAVLWDQGGQSQKAKPLYQQVLQIEPDNPMALNNLAFVMAEEGIGLDEALTMAQKAKQKLPANPEVSDTLGWIYIKKNLSDNAISIFQELVNKHPERATYQFHLAMAYYQKGDKVAARKLLQTALTKSPPKPEEEKIRDLLAKVS